MEIESVFSDGGGVYGSDVFHSKGQSEEKIKSAGDRWMD